MRQVARPTTRANEGAPFPGGNIKAQLWGAGVSYTLGGLYAGIGYEYHTDYITAAARQGAATLVPGAGNTTTSLLSTAGTACAGLGNGFALGGQLAAAGSGATAACMPVGGATTAGLSGDDGNFWNVNLRYTFGFGLSIGGYYEWAKWNMDYGNTTGATGPGLVTELKRDAWRLDAAYQLGAHTFGLQYGHSNKIKGQTSGSTFNGDNTSTDV